MNDAALFRRFGRLMHGIAALTLVLVLVGVIVRSTGSGLGCGTAGGWHDWPLCHGRLIPPVAVDAIIELSHRAFAALVSLCLLGAAAWSLGSAPLRRRVGVGVVLAVVLLVLQIALGALTVRLLEDGQINPAFVVAHLAAAFAFFSTVVVVGMHALRASRTAEPAARFSAGQRIYFLVTCGAVLFQAVLGGLVANLGAAMACPEFPTCAGGVWIPELSGPILLQLVHRAGALIVTALLVGLVIVLRRDPAAPNRLAVVAVGLVAVQFALGVATVLLGLPLMARALHHVFAYALVGTVVGIGYALLSGSVREGAPQGHLDARDGVLSSRPSGAAGEP